MVASRKAASSELEIQDAIRVELGNPEKYPELVLFRNNCGVLTDAHGRYVRYGVGSPGGSDLVGIFKGRFVAAEIKTATGKESDEQRRFGQLVESKGGAYVVLRSVDDARAWIARLRSEWIMSEIERKQIEKDAAIVRAPSDHPVQDVLDAAQRLVDLIAPADGEAR